MKKDLQKFTNSKEKIDYLFSLRRIKDEDLKILNEKEKDEFYDVVTEKFNELKDTERDRFYKQVEPITSKDVKNQLWENNHLTIIQSITVFINEKGMMPSNNMLAKETGLSRQTIHKHLKEYTNHQFFKEDAEKFKIAANKVLSTVFRMAINGDMKAAKIYLNAVSPKVTNQSNYIQINNTILSQENIKQLSQDQLKQIEDIVLTPDMIVE